MSAARVQAIVLDVGGVLAHERGRVGRAAWEARLGLPTGQLDRIVLDSPEAALAPTGAISEPDLWRAVGGRLGLSDADCAALGSDFYAGEVLDDELVQYLQSLRPAYRLAILSNAWSGARAAHARRFGFDRWVETAVMSAEVGLLKPDPRIYALLLEQLKLPAAACLFVDDKPANVDAARALGMQGVVYRDARQAIDAIGRLLNGAGD